MARYIDADKLCEALKSMASVQYPDKQNTILGVVSSIENFPAADVVPKSEVAKEILLDLRRKMHDKAVFPYGEGAYSYVNLKVADAIINEFLNKYTEVKKQ